MNSTVPNSIASSSAKSDEYLACEQPWVYWMLIFAAGWFGGYTFVVRGGVFCNAQTANVVLFGIALGSGNWAKAAYLLLPISAYLAGAFVSEYLGKTVKKFHFLRWDTMLTGIEAIAVFLLGCLPANAPDQICQVALNFICSMQFNTFRQVEGIPAATTFVTNHLRQIGSNFAKYIRHHDQASGNRVKLHGTLTLFFLAGTLISTICAHFFAYQSIWGSCIVLLIIFFRLAHTDRNEEKELLSRVPHGH
ncbi:MAG: YoaK family protein [Eubacterium sp.]|nr:YoaK family protein [Eubacterium sp.]